MFDSAERRKPHVVNWDWFGSTEAMISYVATLPQSSKVSRMLRIIEGSREDYRSFRTAKKDFVCNKSGFIGVPGSSGQQLVAEMRLGSFLEKIATTIHQDDEVAQMDPEGVTELQNLINRIDRNKRIFVTFSKPSSTLNDLRHIVSIT